MLNYNVPTYNFPEINRVAVDTINFPRYAGKRFYTDGEGCLPSVTTVIGDGAAKAAIIGRWKKKWTRVLTENGFTSSEAARYFSLASTRGTALHAAVENFHQFHKTPDFSQVEELDLDYMVRLEELMADLDPDVRKHPELIYQTPNHWWDPVEEYLQGLEGEIIAQELQMFSEETGVAGTCDLAYLLPNGRGVISDYKFTGYSKTKPSKYGNYSWDNPNDMFLDKWLQLEAYGRTYNHLMGEDIIKDMHLISTFPGGVESFLVPMDREERNEVVGCETPDYFEIYQSKLETFIYG